MVTVIPTCLSWLCSCSASESLVLTVLRVIFSPCGYPACASSCFALAGL